MSARSLLALLVFVSLLILSPLSGGGERGGERPALPAATVRPTDRPPTPTPSPTLAVVTPASPPATGEGGGAAQQQSAIEGVVTDLSTGRPAGGIRVQIADVVVRTDGRGHYSLTGLGAWTMPVRLLLSPDEGLPAQDPILVTLDGIHTVVVNLAFYSRPPTPTPSPTPSSPTPPPPSFLPETGGSGKTTW